MTANNDTTFFKKEYERLKTNPEIHREVILGHILELQEILTGMSKGLKILEDMGRKPDKKVAENHQEFQRLITLFEELAP